MNLKFSTEKAPVAPVHSFLEDPSLLRERPFRCARLIQLPVCNPLFVADPVLQVTPATMHNREIRRTD